MFVQQMKAEDYFGIVTFGTTAKVASPLVIMNDENKVSVGVTTKLVASFVLGHRHSVETRVHLYRHRGVHFILHGLLQCNAALLASI